MAQPKQTKKGMSIEQRALRRNQIIWVSLSGIIILTMLISLIRF